MSAPLLKLIQIGSTAEVADAILADPGLAAWRDPQGVSALMWSVYFNQPLVRDFFLSRLAQNSVYLDVFEAAALGKLTQLRELLESNPQFATSYSGDGWTPLHLASAFGTPFTVAALLAAGAHVDAKSRNPQQNEPIHAAVALGKNPETVEMLLSHGASPDAIQAGGFTPIFSAATANRQDIAELLLTYGADPHRRSDQSKTAAEFARERGHSDLAAWLESLPAHRTSRN
jgi:ankyrin repeat protein